MNALEIPAMELLFTMRSDAQWEWQIRNGETGCVRDCPRTYASFEAAVRHAQNELRAMKYAPIYAQHEDS